MFRKGANKSIQGHADPGPAVLQLLYVMLLQACDAGQKALVGAQRQLVAVSEGISLCFCCTV
jgi:hypothetical protein